ncbi:hypothetical protein F5X99DRAFT_403459 [Biscogniauxia marginata]|nr:hypothetical protein F5X99DRAFT_403459 [Biscogniauxia marginata]
MTNTPEPKNTGCPDISPPAMAIRPSALTKEMENLDKARRVSAESRTAYQTLSRKVVPVTKPGEVKLEPNHKDSLELASLGIEAANKQKEEIRLERSVVAKKRDAGEIDSKTAEKQILGLNKRYLSTGDDLWRHQKKKLQLETDPQTIQLWRPGDCGVSECLLALYAKCDGLSKKKRPSNWRKNALDYYEGRSENHNAGHEMVWCHVSGAWWYRNTVKAAHIVPFFADNESLGELLFGRRSESIDEAGNALLLSSVTESWFDNYHAVIVPVDATESPITRWQTDILNPHIRESILCPGLKGQDLDGKELVFLNDKRPASRFLYFHFIMALVRIKDLKRSDWQDVWARYYTQRPFPTPGPYLRKNMLLGLTTHFETTDMSVIESWIAEQGFDSPLKLSENETMEAARRILEATEPAVEKDSSDEEEESLGEDDDNHLF